MQLKRQSNFGDFKFLKNFAVFVDCTTALIFIASLIGNCWLILSSSKFVLLIYCSPSMLPLVTMIKQASISALFATSSAYFSSVIICFLRSPQASLYDSVSRERFSVSLCVFCTQSYPCQLMPSWQETIKNLQIYSLARMAHSDTSSFTRVKS